MEEAFMDGVPAPEPLPPMQGPDLVPGQPPGEDPAIPPDPAHPALPPIQEPPDAPWTHPKKLDSPGNRR